MKAASDSLPSDLAAAHAMILAERQARLAAEAEAANAQADLSSQEALIAHLKLEIEKLRCTLYGPGAERKARILDQLELQLQELETSATQDGLAAEAAVATTQTVRSFQRQRPVRKPFPDDIERERVVIAAPTSCPCCGGIARLKHIEDNDADFVTPEDMLAELKEDNLALTQRMRKTHNVCDGHGDVATASLIEN